MARQAQILGLLLSPMIASAAMTFSSVSVIANAAAAQESATLTFGRIAL